MFATDYDEVLAIKYLGIGVNDIFCAPMEMNMVKMRVGTVIEAAKLRVQLEGFRNSDHYITKLAIERNDLTESNKKLQEMVWL